MFICACSQAKLLPRETLAAAMAAARAAGYRAVSVPDLCGLAADKSEWLAQVAAQAHPLVAACFPRAVRWLFHAAGAPLGDSATLVNLRTQRAEDVYAALNVSAPAPSPPAAEPTETQDPPWIPWFPVIDYSRCVNCGQCKNFCLFGVYELDGSGTVRVQNPTHCKTHCPACARICPRAAIMFPKYEHAPINGDEVTPENLDRQKMQTDMAAALGGDVYEKLRSRQTL